MGTHCRASAVYRPPCNCPSWWESATGQRPSCPRLKSGPLRVKCQQVASQTDDQEETVLVRIIKSSVASRDRYESAQILLLEGGANRDDHSGTEQQDPLRIAAELGDLDMCRLLICTGKMNPLSALRPDNDRQMILKEETSENEQNKFAILQLLRAHADTGSTSNSGH